MLIVIHDVFSKPEGLVHLSPNSIPNSIYEMGWRDWHIIGIAGSQFSLLKYLQQDQNQQFVTTSRRIDIQ